MIRVHPGLSKTSTRSWPLFVILPLSLCCASGDAAAQTVQGDPRSSDATSLPDVEVRITPSDLLAGEEHSFDGSTTYRPDRLEGEPAVHAICDGGTASALFLERTIDLEETPVVTWKWRVEGTLTDVDETTEPGDDYAARLYLIERSGFLSWRARAINYVWASEQPEGQSWPNAYQSEVRMMAVRSGPPDDREGWFVERADVRRDFRRLHDRDVTEISAVAVMTDCDDTGQPLEAWYGEVRFVAE